MQLIFFSFLYSTNYQLMRWCHLKWAGTVVCFVPVPKWWRQSKVIQVSDGFQPRNGVLFGWGVGSWYLGWRDTRVKPAGRYNLRGDNVYPKDSRRKVIFSIGYDFSRKINILKNKGSSIYENDELHNIKPMKINNLGILLVGDLKT